MRPNVFGSQSVAQLSGMSKSYQMYEHPSGPFTWSAHCAKHGAAGEATTMQEAWQIAAEYRNNHKDLCGVKNMKLRVLDANGDLVWPIQPLEK